MKLLLVNDYASLREGIRDLLLLVYPLLQIDEVEDGNQALRLYAERGPYDAVLTDIKHPGPNGLELAKAIWLRNHKQRVGFITAFYPICRGSSDGRDLINFVDKLCAISEATPHRSELPDTPEFLGLCRASRRS